MANSADPDQLASSETNLFWIYTVCKDGISGFSRTRVKSVHLAPFLNLASVAQLDAHPTGDQEVAGLTPTRLATFFHGD